jgi:hypothetical protein
VGVRTGSGANAPHFRTDNERFVPMFNSSLVVSDIRVLFFEFVSYFVLRLSYFSAETAAKLRWAI